MRKLKAFSLIELILVVLLIGLVSFLVIKLPNFNKSYSFENLRELLYPNGEFYLFENGNMIIKNNEAKEINFRYKNFEVMNLNYERVEFPKFENRKVLFYYKMRNGIGDVLIVKSNNVYFFKPLWVLKFKNIASLKKYIDSLQPTEEKIR